MKAAVFVSLFLLGRNASGQQPQQRPPFQEEVSFYLEGPGDAGPTVKEFVILDAAEAPYHPTLGFVEWVCEARGGVQGTSRLVQGRAAFSATKEPNRTPVYAIAGDSASGPVTRARFLFRNGALVTAVPQYFNCWMVIRTRHGQ